MGDAYTPGLTVTESTVVRKQRRLPLRGTVVAKVGDAVQAADVVARTELPGKVYLVNFANALGVLPDEIGDALKVQPGTEIRAGQLLAEHRSFFGLFRASVAAPIDGTFESVSSITGQAVLRYPPTPVEVTAYVDGKVVEIIADEGVVVETDAAMIQGIFGLAGEVNAPLCMVSKAPDAELEPGDLTPDHAGKIVVGGARVTLAAMRRAIELGVAAVVSGGIAYHDVRELLGYDVGVAVTGQEVLGTTLVVTEGFGSIAMARATFELLRRFDGARASVTGATQIRAGVIRPEVIVPRAGLFGDGQAAAGRHPFRDPIDGQDAPAGVGFDVGAAVRGIRAPYFGRIGKIVGLPVELRIMPSETKVRVAQVEFEGGEAVTLPRANVEVIER